MSASSSSDLDESVFDPRARLGECMADKWTLEEVLGRGGMAVVYGATHRNGHRTAIKMLLPHIARDESLVRRFLREGYLANKVQHAGAVRVLDDGRAADGSPFLVMERLDGYTLDAHLEKGKAPLDVRGSLDVMLELLEILDAAHGAGMVHRDIKPANIFRTTHGELKLLDFGIALLVDAGPSSNATLSGAVVGTPAFMAPEQARGRKELVGPRSDLWAVAASGLSLMLGRRLRNAMTSAEELAMAALQPLPPAASFGDRLRGRLGDVLDQALAFEPRDRFATAAEMRAALQPCREGAPAMALTERAAAPAFPMADTVAMHEPPSGRGGATATYPISHPTSASAVVAAPVVVTTSGSPEAADFAARPAQQVTVRGGSSSRVWLVVALVATTVSIVAVGITVVKRGESESRKTPSGTATTAARAATAAATSLPTASASVDPSSVAPQVSPGVAREATTSTAASPSARPHGAAADGRPGAKPAPQRPASSGGSSAAKPDFMDER